MVATCGVQMPNAAFLLVYMEQLGGTTPLEKLRLLQRADFCHLSLFFLKFVWKHAAI